MNFLKVIKNEKYLVGAGFTTCYSFWRYLTITNNDPFQYIHAPAGAYASIIGGGLWPVVLPLLVTHHAHVHVRYGTCKKV